MTAPPKAEKTRVAVLGGGAGALSAVWALVNSPGGEHYEITVYQMGWRLGGKARSGRNLEHAGRIEEPGAQLWSGSYHNAFRMMRQVYRELDRDEGTPLSVWHAPEQPDRSAFVPEDRIALFEFDDGRWQRLTVDFPRNAELPGTAAGLPTPRSYLEAPLRWMREAIAERSPLWELHWNAQSRALPAASRPLFEAGRVALSGSQLLRAARTTSRAFSHRALLRHLESAAAAIGELPTRPGKLRRGQIEAILSPLDEFARAFEMAFDGLTTEHADARHAQAGIDVGVALVRGLLSDQLFERGFDAVDDEELASWFARHGASGDSVESLVLRGVRAFLFASPGGDPSRSSLSAGTGLRVLMRTLFGYAGDVAWKLQAGAGDVVFAPLYEVLSRRPNVHFEFFHVLEELGILKDGAPTNEVQSIQLGRQVDLREGQQQYEPLVRVAGVPSWPSAPLSEQLDSKQAQTLRDYRIDLESAWSPWPPREIVELKKGRDFDLVVLGIPPAELSTRTRQLSEHLPGWQEMLEGLPSVQTQSMQLWLDDDLRGDAPELEASIGLGYSSPFGRWALRRELVDREEWQELGARPRCSLHFCDAVADASDAPTPPAQWFPEEQQQRSFEACMSWLSGSFGPLWPKAAQPGSAAPDWSLLTALRPELEGQQRLRDQCWRIHIDPAQRQLLSPPGTARARPATDEFPVENLRLAGDWLRTGFNAGCFEAAVMGGFQASRAICGWPARIVGDGDFIQSPASDRAQNDDD